MALLPLHPQQQQLPPHPLPLPPPHLAEIERTGERETENERGKKERECVRKTLCGCMTIHTHPPSAN